VEHRGDLKRQASAEPGPATGPSAAGVFGRPAADGDRDVVSPPGGLARGAQPAGGSGRRGGQPNGSQRTAPFLRAAEHRQALDDNTPAHRRRDGSGDGGISGTDAQKIIDSLSTAVVLLDRALLITAINPAAENILGISAQRAYGESLQRLVGDEPELRDILSRVIETGDHYANELHLPPTEAHHAERIVDCHVSPLLIGPAVLLVEMTDVTRRLKISRENALLIQHGAGRQMIRQLAHEIKNPLGGIRGAAQLLERQLENKELTEYTDVVISETDRLAGLVDTLLGPGGPPDKQPVNVHELLEYVVRIVDAEDQRSLNIRRDYDPGLPEIELDRAQIVQAFLNLVQNAAAALEGQGTITLRTRAVSNFTIGDTRHRVIASIEIQDDGPGIPRDLQDSVFYPLVTSRTEGTGLGLPAAQELISRHDGIVEFESRPGHTVFYVRLPLTTAGATKT